MSFKTHQLYILLIVLMISGCAIDPNIYTGGKTPAPKSATSKPYKITNSHMKDKWFHPKQHYEHVEEGHASYYGGRDVFHGRKTASGDVFDKNKLMAAHRTLPIPSMIRVTNIDPKTEGYGRSVKIPVLDRGPFAHIGKRIIDVSEKSAKVLGFYREGTAKVRVEALVEESLQLAQNRKLKTDDRVMMAKGFEKKSTIRLAMQKNRKLQIASLSKENMKYLLSAPKPKQSPFAQSPFGKAVSPPQRILVAQSNKVADQVIKPLKKPTSIDDLFKETSSEGDTGIFIQAGPYSHLKKVKELKGSLGHQLTSENIKVSKIASQYRVRVGPFESSEDAEYLLAQLEQQGHDEARIIYE